MKNTRAVGTDYEKQAAEYLETRGYHILEKNFRCRMGEIDLIAEEDGYLVFIEVKYRAGTQMGEPQEAVNFRKQQKISRAASYYCLRYKISPQKPCRFDVIACMGGEWTIIQNAFDYIQ